MGGKWGPKAFLLKKNSGKTIREEKIEKTFSFFFGVFLVDFSEFFFFSGLFLRISKDNFFCTKKAFILKKNSGKTSREEKNRKIPSGKK